jgi:hypothetical protein
MPEQSRVNKYSKNAGSHPCKLGICSILSNVIAGPEICERERVDQKNTKNSYMVSNTHRSEIINITLRKLERFEIFHNLVHSSEHDKPV